MNPIIYRVRVAGGDFHIVSGSLPMLLAHCRDQFGTYPTKIDTIA